MTRWGELLAVCLVAGAAFLHLDPAFAESKESKAVPTLPGEDCKIPPRDEWTDSEEWAWKQICEGKVADFDLDLGEIVSDRSARRTPERRLSGAFLETILFYNPFKSALTRKGVRINGAWFSEPLDLENAKTKAEIWLHNSWFDGDVNLSGFGVRHLDLGGSTFAKAANLSYLVVNVSVFLEDTNFLEALNLRHARVGGDIRLNRAILSHQKAENSHVPLRIDEAKIGGNISMSGGDFGETTLNHTTIDGTLTISNARFFGPLEMNSLHVESHLSIADQSSLVSINLVGATIGGQLGLTHSFVREEADLDGIDVKAAMYLDGSVFFQGTIDLGDAEIPPVKLAGAKIGGQLSAVQAYFESGLDLNWTTINGAAIFRLAEFAGPLNLRYAEIQEILDLSGTELVAVDLEGGKIEDELRLYSRDYKGAYWAENGVINLSRAKTATIRDSPSAWPDLVRMQDFTYQQWTAIEFWGQKTAIDPYSRNSAQWTAFNVTAFAPDAEMKRSLDWFSEWLRRDTSPAGHPLDKSSSEAVSKDDDTPFSMQPYVQLAKIFLENGHFQQSESILYNGLNRKRQTTSGLERVWLEALHWTTGYGYRFDRLLLWILFFTVTGALVLLLSGQGKKNKMANGFFYILYSVDILIPAVEIDPRHYDRSEINIGGWARYYFYTHKIAGIILAACLATAVTERVFGGT